MQTKQCKKCLQEKSYNAFGKDKHKPDGLTTYCRQCRNKRAKSNRFELLNSITFDKSKESFCFTCKTVKPLTEFKGTLFRCKTCLNKYFKDYNIERRYNITKEQYYELYNKQGGKCKICGKKEGKRALHVDHSHITHKVRALLCQGCNHLIGQCHESIEILQNSIKYLQEYNT